MVSSQRKTFTKCKKILTEMFLNLLTGINYCIDLSFRFTHGTCVIKRNASQNHHPPARAKCYNLCLLYRPRGHQSYYST